MFKWKIGKDIGLVALDTIEAMRHHDTYRQDWHAHPFWETHYILSGRLTYEFAEAAPVTILGGAFLVIPPNTRHCAVNMAGTPSVHLGTRWLSPSAHAACSPFTLAERKSIFATLESKTLVAQSIPSDLMRDVRELFAAVESDETDKGHVRLLAWTVLSRTARAARTGNVLIRESDDAVVRAVADRIRRDCGGNFAATFRRYEGVTPSSMKRRRS